MFQGQQGVICLRDIQPHRSQPPPVHSLQETSLHGRFTLLATTLVSSLLPQAHPIYLFMSPYKALTFCMIRFYCCYRQNLVRDIKQGWLHRTANGRGRGDAYRGVCNSRHCYNSYITRLATLFGLSNARMYT